MRIHYGPGYRVYFLQAGEHLILLLAGGDKATQNADIVTARAIADTWRRGQEGDHESRR